MCIVHAAISINVFSVDECILNCFDLQYATVEKDNEKYLTYKGFVCDYLRLVDQKDNSEFINLIAKIADTTKNGYGVFSCMYRIAESINEIKHWRM